MDNNQIRIIGRCIQHATATAFNEGLEHGLQALRRAYMNVGRNHERLEPHPELTLAEWILDDIEKLEAQRKDPGLFPRV